MCRTQCVLALAAMYVGLAHSWDIAVSVGDELIFYTNGSKTDTVTLIFHNFAAIAYDEVHDRMLYVSRQKDNDAICGYNLHSKKDQCFIKRNSGVIDSIAFDPATDTIFFTDTNERSINWVTLKSDYNTYGNLLIKMDDGTPSDIAVDSCRGYIYWTSTNDKKLRYENLERARFNGSERKVIAREYSSSYTVFSLAMDPQTRKIFYIDGHTGKYRYINSADLDGKKEHNILLNATELFISKELTVSNDYLYWMNSSESYKTLWQIPKNATTGAKRKEISKFYSESPLGIAVNYKIKDQTQGLQDCEVLSSLVPKITVTNSFHNIQQTTEYTTVAELFCVHGTKVNEMSACKCTPGYIGERCDVSVCENYCLQGNCSFNDEGLPKCRCNAGYSGERCEVYACHGYCVNNGDCSLNEEDEPVCQCVGNHEGTRCEAVKDVTLTFTNTPTYYTAERDLTLADLLSNWRKLSANISVVVENKSS